MQTLPKQTNNPIFIVSPGRSGSTILTWCLGQHPNILPQEESNWLGPFAIDAAVAYERGSMRGERGQLSSNFVQRDEFLARLGQTINELIVSQRKMFEDLGRRQEAGWGPPPFKISRSEAESKSRWADGTPENSFYIYGLRKLFPQASFVHLVRDVRDVVRSLLNFFPDGQNRLVADEQAAYEHWLRRATCCFEAEQAYGSDVVHRMRYSDLVTRSEMTMRSLLEFLGEPYAPQCLEPLAQRINSAEVPADFDSSDPTTDPTIVEQASQLSEHLQSSPQTREPSLQVLEKLEAEFKRQIEHFYNLEAKYSNAQQLIAKFEQERQLLSGSWSTRRAVRTI